MAPSLEEAINTRPISPMLLALADALSGRVLSPSPSRPLSSTPTDAQERAAAESVAAEDPQLDVKNEKGVVDSDDDDAASKELTTAVDPEVNPGGLTFEEDAAGGMGRHLGVFSCTLLIVGRIIGTGIFSTTSTILNSVGSIGASLMLWVLGFILSFCGLFIWLEFGTMFPRSGGEKVYLEASYKKPKYLVTVIFAANAILLGFTASGCIHSILVTAGHTADRWVTRGIALAVIFFVTLLHGLTPRLGVYVMNVRLHFVVLSAYLIPADSSASGWVVLSGATSIKDSHTHFHNAFAGSSHSSNDYATATFKVLNSYAGWSNVNYVLNNVKNPVRTLKIAGPLGLGICAVLYLLANVAYFAAATKEEIAHSGVTVASLFFKKVFGATAQKALTVFVALSALGWTFAASRVNQELAKEGIPLPSAVIVILGPPPAVAYPFIVDVEGYPQQIINFFIVAGLFYLRWHKPNLPRPFKVWWPLAVFFLAASVFLLVAPFLRPANGVGDTPPLPYYLCVSSMVLSCRDWGHGAGVVYWAAWRVLPGYLGYELIPRKEKLDDGTVVTLFSHKKID
ncbi:high affinity methionine permease [Epithele typhae]|uniref:high affinity methionine permease n=1 Tax=Epithele typhae TaxID=378194 RepID=UPI0020078C37|nr:high affinity methionine permease [Epithele typhae]KAH9923426.1 high affinity methionine permease [Epithele typhae]